MGGRFRPEPDGEGCYTEVRAKILLQLRREVTNFRDEIWRRMICFVIWYRGGERWDRFFGLIGMEGSYVSRHEDIQWYNGLAIYIRPF